jgi:AmmeMemoRadiSam system protein A
LGERQAYIVASTDLSHYHSYEEAHQMDEVALQAILSLDPQAVVDSSRRCAELGLGSGDPVTMCSQGAVMTAMIAAQQMGADRGTVLHYATSGDVPIGDRAAVVGYGAVALWQSQLEQNLPNPKPQVFTIQDLLQNSEGLIPLSPEAQHELLTLARHTIAHFVATETFPPFHTDDPALLQPMGAYVTYEDAESGMLRGCLGRLEGDRPAYLNVQYAAVAAALADSRFPPVDPEELETLTLEITLLEPMQLVTSPQEIQIGRDGVLMRLGERQGALFLPQVPLEEGWDQDELLVNLCRKAGLPDDAWQRSDARFYVFAGQWFGERD